MESKITVGVCTRDRPQYVIDFVHTFKKSTSGAHPKLVVIQDNPEAEAERDVVKILEGSGLNYLHYSCPVKQSHTELWNSLIILSDTEWTLVCNDDIEFHSGWYEYICSNLDNYLQINLQHYGGFCISKRMILELGWFDESFRGGGFEDIDWQLRIDESKVRNMVDTSMDDKIIKHRKLKYSMKNSGHWSGNNNHLRIMEKWGRDNPWGYHTPSFRCEKEVDWHPEYTKIYEELFNKKSRLEDVNQMMGSGVGVHP